jgi:hypothetical protein
MELKHFIAMTADDIEGEVGGCLMDDLRHDERFFEAAPDPYDIRWFVSRERSAQEDDMPRHALAIHKGAKYTVDLDEYTTKLDEETATGEDTGCDNVWRRV